VVACEGVRGGVYFVQFEGRPERAALVVLSMEATMNSELIERLDDYSNRLEELRGFL